MAVAVRTAAWSVLALLLSSGSAYAGNSLGCDNYHCPSSDH